MRKVEKGDYVKVHYTGKYEDGEVFDSSCGCRPVEIRVGAREVLPGFENALLGMAPEEKKSFTLKAAEAFGERDDSLERAFQLSDFPEGYQPEVGQVIVLENPGQGNFPATVKSIQDEEIVLDLNHPLAGRSVTFDVEVIEITDEPTSAECGCGCSSCS